MGYAYTLAFENNSTLSFPSQSDKESAMAVLVEPMNGSVPMASKLSPGIVHQPLPTSANFLVPTDLYKSEKPYMLDYTPEATAKKENTTVEKHDIEINDIRGRENEFTFAKNGFCIVPINTNMSHHDYNSDDKVKSVSLALLGLAFSLLPGGIVENSLKAIGLAATNNHVTFLDALNLTSGDLFAVHGLGRPVLHPWPGLVSWESRWLSREDDGRRHVVWRWCIG
jgi:hypothetical protein